MVHLFVKLLQTLKLTNEYEFKWQIGNLMKKNEPHSTNEA